MKKVIFTILLTTFCITNLLAQTKPTAEEYTVYAAVLKGDDKTLIVIANQTSIVDSPISEGGGLYKALKNWIPKQANGLIEDFAKKNKESSKLERKFSFKNKYKLVTREKINKTLGKTPEKREKGWENFYKTFPNSNGFFDISRVGFSFDKQYAMVFVANLCGYIRGYGNYLLFQKINDAWKKQSGKVTWIS